jgi:hypothetical protein
MKSVLASTFPSLAPNHTGLVPIANNGATGSAGAESSPFIHLGAAAIAGIVTSTATNPIWGKFMCLTTSWSHSDADPSLSSSYTLIVVKTRLQLEARHKENNNIAKTVASATSKTGVAGTSAVTSKLVPAWTMTKDILSKEGIRGMYKGMSASYLGVSEGVIQLVAVPFRASKDQETNEQIVFLCRWVLYEVRREDCKNITKLCACAYACDSFFPI